MKLEESLLWEQKFAQIATGIGLLTIEWARVEHQLEEMCLTMWKNGGRTEIRDKIPRAFIAKIRFLETGTKRLPWVFYHATRLVDLLAKLEELSTYRHDLTHGAMQLTDPNRKSKESFFRRNIYEVDGFGIAE